MNSTQLECLLCGSGRISIVHSLTSEEILKCWARIGVRFTDSAVSSLRRRNIIELQNCDSCGFQFFDPALAGSAEFYEQLHAADPGYYSPNREENERNARYAVRHGFKTILDVGCGTGSALDCAKRYGLETFGIELSKTAAREAASRGHTVFPVLLERMDSKWERKFDLISLNQLLEHVPDPKGIIRQCVRLLSPHGVIAVALPGRFGILRFTPWLESNWPPHHVSRWQHRDFDTLARNIGLKVIKRGGDRLLGSSIESILVGHQARAKALSKNHLSLSPSFIRLFSFVYRKGGFKFLFHSQGHSIYAFLSR